MKQWYQELFENNASNYDRESYTKGTVGECDFIEQEIAHNKTVRILDVGCGTGRHAIELARRGYTVVGVDLSESQLNRASEKAVAENLKVTFRHLDARDLPFSSEFGLVVMLCGGGFPLMETDEMNFRILQCAAGALRPGGKLIFTALNGLYPLFHSMKEFYAAGASEGGATIGDVTFDLMTFREKSTVTFKDDLGNAKVLQCNERYYVPSEITWLLKNLGFDTIEIFGAKLGAFSRDDSLTSGDFEMLVVAVKG